MTEGGQEAVRTDDDVVPAADAMRFEERGRELERQLGGKTVEVELLKEALDLARTKKAISLSSLPPRDWFHTDINYAAQAEARPIVTEFGIFALPSKAR
jgi:hypothetical protein